MSLIAELRSRGRTGLADLKAAYLASAPASAKPLALLQARARQVDGILRELWTAQGFDEAAALIAVGGYGRGELYPASDVDLLILLPEGAQARYQDRVEAMVGLFWDIGLEVGHSVRSIEECIEEARRDISVDTAMLESRLLAGSQTLFDEFRARIVNAMNPQAFFQAKVAEQQERYLRYQETPYSLEPNCKESPGGLRDLQVLVWVAKGSHIGRSGDGSWDDLFNSGLVTAQERANLVECERFLQDLRIRLHLLTGRREDRLVFDVQNTLADHMGYVARDDRRASERMMQAYYKNAKSITQLNTLLLQTIGNILFPPEDAAVQTLDASFHVVGNQLDLIDAKGFEKQPGLILDAFWLLQQHRHLNGMSSRTLRLLYDARNRIDDTFRADSRNRSRFLSLFQSPHGIVHEFRRMNQWGILGRYIPAFGRIVGQMQHDLFHVYTVDQHILQVMRNVRCFTMEEHAHEYPNENRLMQGFDSPWLLYVAALFHDIAKGRGGDHSTLGMVDAKIFCQEHGLSEADTELVVWLVGEHLTMSQVAQKEDIADPDVVRAFAERVKTPRRLTALYLLTVADIRGTSPKVWNVWKAQLLAALYQSTLSVLQEGKPLEIQGIVTERQREAMRLMRFFALSDAVQERLWKQLDTVYFLRHSADEIAWHTRSLHYRLRSEFPIVRARLYRTDADHLNLNESAGIQVLVYTEDAPDLFLRMASFFAKNGFSIVDAKIHTTKDGYALDSFVVLDVHQRDEDRELIAFIEYELAERLRHGDRDDQPLTGRLSREVKHFPIQPQISIRPDDRGKHFILSIVAADRPGLLHTVASSIAAHNANIETAKIATLGQRVEDTFLISGGDLQQSGNRIRLETELLDRLKL